MPIPMLVIFLPIAILVDIFLIRMDCNRICNFGSQQGDGASLTEAFLKLKGLRILFP